MSIIQIGIGILATIMIELTIQFSIFVYLVNNTIGGNNMLSFIVRLAAFAIITI